MKKLITLLCLLVTPTLASIQDAALEYFTNLYTAKAELKPHDDVEKSAQSAVEKLIKINRTFLFVSGEERKKIEQEGSVFTAEQFSSTAKAFSRLNPVDPESKYILSTLKTKVPTGYEQLFFYRYIKHKSLGIKGQGPKSSTGGGGGGQFSQIVAIYNKKANELGKIPSFEELELPIKLKFYVHPKTGEKMNWIYVADAKNAGYNDPHPLLAIPVPRSSGRATTLRIDGSISPHFSFKKIKKFDTNQTNIEEALKKAEPRIDVAYLKTLQDGASVIINRHRLYKTHPSYKGAKSNGVAQLKFTNDEHHYKSQDGSSTHTWLYLGATHKIVYGNKRVICMTDTPVIGENHLGFFEDGTQIEITPKQYAVILVSGM